MRKLTVAAALLMLPSLALAKRSQKTEAPVAVVDDEPTSKLAPKRTARPPTDPTVTSGTRMDAAIRAPEVAHVRDTGEAISRAPVAGQTDATRDEGPASGDALNELVAKQMRRNGAGIDACVSAAVHRRPSLSGSVSLAVVVADRKVKSVHVASDSAHDIDLDACLVKAGLAWKLQLAAASFTWPVTISPSASR